MNTKFFSLLKKLVVGVGLTCALCMGFTNEAKATSITTNIAAATTNGIIASSTNGALIYQFQFVNTTATNIYITLFDSPTTNYSYGITNGYTNSVISTVIFTNIYTNILGTPTTNIYTNIMNTSPTNVVAGYTNNYNILWTGICLSNNTTTTFTPPINIYAYQGIAFTNSLFTNGVGQFNLTAIFQSLR